MRDLRNGWRHNPWPTRRRDASQPVGSGEVYDHVRFLVTAKATKIAKATVTSQRLVSARKRLATRGEAGAATQAAATAVMSQKRERSLN
jgi:hypothetical protein